MSCGSCTSPRNCARRKAELTNGPPSVDNLYDKVDVTGSGDKRMFASFIVFAESTSSAWEPWVVGVEHFSERVKKSRFRYASSSLTLSFTSRMHPYRILVYTSFDKLPAIVAQFLTDGSTHG